MENTEEKKGKLPDEEKSWMDFIMEFIKNPVVTGASMATAGYLYGKYVGRKEVNELKEEFQMQLKARDEQVDKLISQMTQTNKLVESAMNGLAEKKKRYELEEDGENRYSFKPKRKFLSI